MSQQELKRVEVIALRRAGQIKQAEAARRLGLTERQVRRLEAKVARYGVKSLRSTRRGQPSNRRLAAKTVAKVSTLIRTHYHDFGPTLAAEYLQERHGIELSKETVRQIMIKAKLWRPQRGAKARIHAARERRPRCGELIQIDGSHHAWFEERGPHCCLLVFIDDATSRITNLRFLPTLGIGSICANSPQAKGRVERANGVLQDRLLKAMRIEGIDTIDAANNWLPSFIKRHNARFAIDPVDAQDAHVPHSPADNTQLRQILAKHYPRKLSNTLSCQFHSTLLQIQPSAAGGTNLRGAAVTVVEHFDQSCQVLWRQVVLPHTTVQKERAAPLEQGRKEVAVDRRTLPRPEQSAHHPWKKYPVGKLSPEFIARR